MTSNAEASSSIIPYSFPSYLPYFAPVFYVPYDPSNGPLNLVPSCHPVDPSQQLPPTRAKRHKEKDLSRDDRVGLQKMHQWTGWGASEIQQFVPFTARQVQYALATPLELRKTRPKPGNRRLSIEQLTVLDSFLQQDRSHRDIAWQDLRFVVPGFVDVGLTAIYTGLDSLGYARRQTGQRPRTSPAIRRARLDMCDTILARWPDVEDWIEGNIIWSDEKTFYSTDQGIRPTTVHESEDIRDFRHIRQPGNAVNHWGSFCGRWKGPNYIFPHGMTNNGRTYRLGPLRLANSFLWQLRQLGRNDVVFMQDNSSVHTCAFVQGWIAALDIPLLCWAAWSPDLNPIENLWFLMEVWIDDNYDTENLTVRAEEEAANAAWEAITEETLIRLTLVARERFMKCIDQGDRKSVV